jgi:hypothetical protein
MDDIAFLHGRIESYADYTNDDCRQLVDEQVRAYVGEALARVLERLAPDGSAGEALARVLLRCQFADQTVVRTLEVDEPTASDMQTFHRADRELITLADEADALGPDDVGAWIMRIDAALDGRVRLVMDAAASRMI